MPRGDATFAVFVQRICWNYGFRKVNWFNEVVNYARLISKIFRRNKLILLITLLRCLLVTLVRWIFKVQFRINRWKHVWSISSRYICASNCACKLQPVSAVQRLSKLTKLAQKLTNQNPVFQSLFPFNYKNQVISLFYAARVCKHWNVKVVGKVL